MKMKMYYVVKGAEGSLEGYEVDYVAGPFTFDVALAYRDSLPKSYDYSIVDQTVQVS